jgi:hypothetical protein
VHPVAAVLVPAVPGSGRAIPVAPGDVSWNQQHTMAAVVVHADISVGDAGARPEPGTAGTRPDRYVRAAW